CWTLVLLGEMVAFVSLSVPPMNKTGLALAGAFGILIALTAVARGIRLLIAGRRSAAVPPAGDGPGPPGNGPPG
ncbi:phosphoribosyltransferase, partial [Micromonospora aurantiaca]|nr:phosphoribosyltransferase [Micromonospora aurantiaca]